VRIAHEQASKLEVGHREQHVASNLIVGRCGHEVPLRCDEVFAAAVAELIDRASVSTPASLGRLAACRPVRVLPMVISWKAPPRVIGGRW
jgi:hypothetical protein